MLVPSDHTPIKCHSDRDSYSRRDVLRHEHELALRVVLCHLAAECLLAGELVAVQEECRESRQLCQLSGDGT
jgi:hypothetical protein